MTIIYENNVTKFNKIRINVNEYLRFFNINIFSVSLLILLFRLFMILHITSCVWIHTGSYEMEEGWINYDYVNN
jgi:hypothetical protein